MPARLLIGDDERRRPVAVAGELAGAILGGADRAVVLDFASELAAEGRTDGRIREQREPVHAREG